MTPLVSGHIMHRGVPECFFLGECYRPVEREILDGGDGDGSRNINTNIKRTDLNIIKVTQCTEMKEIDHFIKGPVTGFSPVLRLEPKFRSISLSHFLARTHNDTAATALLSASAPPTPFSPLILPGNSTPSPPSKK